MRKPKTDIERELTSPLGIAVVHRLMVEVMQASGPTTFQEAIDELYPELDSKEVDRLADILETIFIREGILVNRDGSTPTLKQ
jgi:hypothetical protein